VVIIVGVAAVIGLIAAALISARPEVSNDVSAAPNFTLPASDGSTFTLAEEAGTPVLLYFNEGAGCDACIQQMAAIEQDPAFADAGIKVVPIVMNTAEQINAERERLGVSAPFLMDDGKVSAAYGTLGTGMHAGLPGHGFVLINADGQQVWSGDYPSMWIEPSELFTLVEEALA
jgi:peroxiredoxin